MTARVHSPVGEVKGLRRVRGQIPLQENLPLVDHRDLDRKRRGGGPGGGGPGGVVSRPRGISHQVAEVVNGIHVAAPIGLGEDRLRRGQVGVDVADQRILNVIVGLLLGLVHLVNAAVGASRAAKIQEGAAAAAAAPPAEIGRAHV